MQLLSLCVWVTLHNIVFSSSIHFPTNFIYERKKQNLHCVRIPHFYYPLICKAPVFTCYQLFCFEVFYLSTVCLSPIYPYPFPLGLPPCYSPSPISISHPPPNFLSSSITPKIRLLSVTHMYMGQGIYWGVDTLLMASPHPSKRNDYPSEAFSCH